jgi:hypothetical protein
MGIRGSLTKGLLIALAFTLIPVSAISAQKITPGSTCKVLNQKVVYLSKTYTCIKSGKKLAWNKGVALKATPTPTPFPTPTPSPKKSPDTPEGLAIQQTLFKGWQNLINIPPSKNVVNFKEYVDSSYPKEAYRLIKEGISSVLGKYGDLIPQNTKIYIIFSTTYDFEINAIKSEPDMYQAYLREDPNSTNHTWRIEQYMQAGYLSGGTFPINGRDGYVLYFRTNDLTSPDSRRYLGAHETMHLIQWQINSEFPQVLPAWWIEGQAQLGAEVIGNVAQTTDSIDSEMIRLMGDGYRAGVTDLSKAEGDPVTRTEFNCVPCSTSVIYSRGKLAVDYLVSKYGNDKVIAYMRSLTRQNLWWQAFESTFGMKVDDFYSEVEKIAIWYGDYYAPGWRDKQ